MGFVVADARFERACRPFWAVGTEAGDQNEDTISLHWLRGRIAFETYRVKYGDSPTAAGLSSWKKWYSRIHSGSGRRHIVAGDVFWPGAFNTSSMATEPRHGL